MASDAAYQELISSGLVVQALFDQNLEMDDDQVLREFTFELVEGFFVQALQKFPEMTAYLSDEKLTKQERLKKLYADGHYLKGSSSGIGLAELPNVFEKICEVTDVRPDEPGAAPRVREGEDLRLSKVGPLLSQAKREFNKVRPVLQRFYGAGRFSKEACSKVE